MKERFQTTIGRRRLLSPSTLSSSESLASPPPWCSLSRSVCSPSGTCRSCLERRRWERLSRSVSQQTPEEAMSFTTGGDDQPPIEVVLGSFARRLCSLVRRRRRASFALRMNKFIVCCDGVFCWSHRIPAATWVPRFPPFSLFDCARRRRRRRRCCCSIAFFTHLSLFLSPSPLLPLNQTTGRKPASSRA